MCIKIGMILNRNTYFKFYKNMGYNTPAIEKMYIRAKKYTQNAENVVGKLSKYNPSTPSRGRSRTRKLMQGSRARSRAVSRGRK
jgi:hypothetical protein